MKIFNSEIKFTFQNFIFEPIIAGLYGFATYFFVLLFIKVLQYYIGLNIRFKVDINDVILASVGFLLVFLIRLLQNVNERMKLR